ncbi:MAG: hypothetical protein LBQ37_02535 [Elusimicrobiota bacterium]|jgi:hypothetical protein|nr:hypothetical protein [Elusimicrobiota bacterium]
MEKRDDDKVKYFDDEKGAGGFWDLAADIITQIESLEEIKDYDGMQLIIYNILQDKCVIKKGNKKYLFNNGGKLRLRTLTIAVKTIKKNKKDKEKK